MKTTITRNEYLQIVGLLTLAKRHRNALEEIDASLCEITGDEQYGHSSDACWSGEDMSADELLRKMKIALAPPQSPPTPQAPEGK